MVNLISYWSIVPILLKPDALEGEASTVTGVVAADFAAYLAAAIDSLSVHDYAPFVEESQTGAQRAREHALGEMKAISWYTMSLKNVANCQRSIQELHIEWAQTPTIDVPQIISQACVALGFEIVLSTDRMLTAEDYMAFYRDTDQPDMHDRMQQFLVGKPVRLILVCGQQENSALQILKTYLRYVMRYPTTTARIENWLHVTNPDASNYPELLRMYAAAYGVLQPSRALAGRATTTREE